MELTAVKKSYARWAPIYDRSFGAITQKGRRSAVNYINQSSGAEVLEVGVGTGLALPLYNPDMRVTAIDYSDEMLEKAREKVKEQNLTHIKALKQMDARALDFSDSCFDIVAAMHVLSVVPEPEKVMSEIARVLKPGGEVVITNHFDREKGFLAAIEKVSAPFANLLGWHSDFKIETVLQEKELSIAEQKTIPPFGMMTFLVLVKSR